MTTSSGYMTNLAPKPPPTSGATTRIWFSSSRNKLHQESAHLVRKLRRRPQCQPILVGVIHRNRAATLDRMGAAAVLLEIDPRAVRRARKCRGDVAVGLAKFDEEIAGLAAMRERGARTQRRSTIGYRRQQLVIDVDQSGGIFGDGTRLRDHDGDSLADESDFVLGKNDGGNVRWQLLGAELKWQPLLRQHRRNVGKREHRVYARQPARRAGVDTANCGVRVRTAHESRLKRARKFEIVDETAATLKERSILETQHSFADCVSLHHIEHVSEQYLSRFTLNGMVLEPRRAVPRSRVDVLAEFWIVTSVGRYGIEELLNVVANPNDCPGVGPTLATAPVAVSRSHCLARERSVLDGVRRQHKPF